MIKKLIEKVRGYAKEGLFHIFGSKMIAQIIRNGKNNHDSNKQSTSIGPARQVDFLYIQSAHHHLESNCFLLQSLGPESPNGKASSLQRNEDAEFRAHMRNFQVLKKLTLSPVSSQLTSLKLLNLVKQFSQRSELSKSGETSIS